MNPKTLLVVGAAIILSACDKAPAPPPTPDAQPVAEAPAPQPVAPAPVAQTEAARTAPREGPSTYANDTGGDDDFPRHPVYADYRPPLAQPQPVAVPWAPPPLLGDEIPPQPSPDDSWTGGYWVWHEGWEWAPGHWSRPPRPEYHWVPPYYEHRNNQVVFVDGFWGAPGVSFIRPAATVAIVAAVIGAAFIVGRPPVGPEGSFVPPPPGSRWGLIVPAPVGTAPYVVRGAPAIVAPGMRVTNNITRVNNDSHNTTINRNTTVVNNITNVTIEAPASATVNHQAVHATVTPQTHLAQGLPAVAARPIVTPAPTRAAPTAPPPTTARTPEQTPPPRPHTPDRPAPAPVAAPREEAPRPVAKGVLQRAEEHPAPREEPKPPAPQPARKPEVAHAPEAPKAVKEPAPVVPRPQARPQPKPAPPPPHAAPPKPAEAAHKPAPRDGEKKAEENGKQKERERD